MTIRALIAFTLTAATCGTALAQQAPAAQPSTSPQRTTATYEDWTVRCETRVGPPAVKACEMVQAVTAPGQANPVTQVAIGRAAPKEPMKAVFQLPVNVWIPGGVRFVYDPKAQPLAASFRSCMPAGCFADLDLNADLIKRLRALGAQGRFEFKDAAQRDIAIPVSFKGFGTAYDALLKE